MFSCTLKQKRKKADKIESMASWLILGGVLPLAVGAIIQNQQGFTFAEFLTLERYPYVWTIAMGALSLCVNRADMQWRFIVALGIIGFLTSAWMQLQHTDLGGAIWPIAATLLVFMQYRYDMKKPKRRN